MNKLKMIYPNMPKFHWFNVVENANSIVPVNYSQTGDIRKSSIDLAKNASFHTHVNNRDIFFTTDILGNVVEYTDCNGPHYICLQETTQELKNVDNVQFKTTTIKPLQGGRDSYKSIERLDTENGLYSVVRKKGDRIIGGYEVNLKQADRKFATGFKGKLEKLALRIATDANGCERKGLRNIGDLVFKIAKRIK